MGRRKRDERPGVMIGRPAWDSWMRRMAIKLGCNPREAQAEVDRQYPYATIDCILEARARGLQASEFLAAQFARKNQIPSVSGVIVWTKQSIDDFVIDLADRGYFTPQSRQAYALGRRESDFLELVTSLSLASPGNECLTAERITRDDRTDEDFGP